MTQLYTFIVDGEEHFKHGTAEAVIGLMVQWGRGDYEVHEYPSERDCDIEFGDHDHDDEECAITLSNMNPEPFYEGAYDEQTWYANRGGQGMY